MLTINTNRTPQQQVRTASSLPRGTADRPQNALCQTSGDSVILAGFTSQSAQNAASLEHASPQCEHIPVVDLAAESSPAVLVDHSRENTLAESAFQVHAERAGGIFRGEADFGTLFGEATPAELTNRDGYALVEDSRGLYHLCSGTFLTGPNGSYHLVGPEKIHQFTFKQLKRLAIVDLSDVSPKQFGEDSKGALKAGDKFEQLFGNAASPNGSLEGNYAQLLILNREDRRFELLAGKLKLDPQQPGNVLLQDKQGAQRSVSLAEAHDFAIDDPSSLAKYEFKKACAKPGMLMLEDLIDEGLAPETPEALGAILAGRQIAALFQATGKFEFHTGTVAGGQAGEIAVEGETGLVSLHQVSGARLAVFDGAVADFPECARAEGWLVGGSEEFRSSFPGRAPSWDELEGSLLRLLVPDPQRHAYSSVEGVVRGTTRGHSTFSLVGEDGSALPVNGNFVRGFALRPTSSVSLDSFQKEASAAGMLTSTSAEFQELFGRFNPEEVQGRQAFVLKLNEEDNSLQMIKGRIEADSGALFNLIQADGSRVALNSNLLKGVALEDFSALSPSEFRDDRKGRGYLVRGSEGYREAFGTLFDSRELAGKAASVLLVKDAQYHAIDGVIRPGEPGTLLFELNTAAGVVPMNYNQANHMAIKP